MKGRTHDVKGGSGARDNFSDGNQGFKKKFKKPVSTGLSLEKFATAKVSKYNKREVLEKQREERLIKLGRFKKLKHRLEAKGLLHPVQAVDNSEYETAAALRPAPGWNNCPCGSRAAANGAALSRLCVCFWLC